MYSVSRKPENPDAIWNALLKICHFEFQVDSDIDWGGPTTIQQHRHLMQVLQQCQEGMETCYTSDKWLYQKGLVSDDPPNFALAHLESTLLQLSATKNVVEGVFYAFAVPTEAGEVFVR